MSKKKNKTSLLLKSLRKNNVKTQEEREDYILSALEEGNNRILSKLSTVNQWIQEEAKWAEAWAPIEEKLYERFRKIVKDKNDFFKIAHVDELDLEYEILIFLGKKNIGKTTEIYRLMEESIERGKNFIYIRYSRNELEKSREAFNSDSISPVRMLKDSGVWKFYPSDLIRTTLLHNGEDPDKVVNIHWIRKNMIPFCGYAYEFCYCQSYTGSQYENFELVLYDECLTYDPRNTLKDTHLNNWAAFLSSIARNKPNLKVFLFGNLQGTNNQILDFYGIDRDSKFRYIAREGGEGCRILFINGGELYRGYEEQNRAARHAGGTYAMKLSGNEYLVTSTELIEPKIFQMFKTIVFFEFLGHIFLLKSLFIQNSRIYAVRVKTLEGHEEYEGFKIYSSDRTQCSRYSNLTYTPTIEPYLERLFFAIWFKKIKYYSEDTMDICLEILDKNPLKIDMFERVI